MPFHKQPTTKFVKFKYNHIVKFRDKPPGLNYAYELDDSYQEPIVKIFQQLWGGLRGKLKPAHYYKEFFEEDDYKMLRCEQNCFEIINSTRKRYAINNKRAHLRFSEGNKRLAYLPLLYKPMHLASKYCTLMWHVQTNFAKTDQCFTHEVKKALDRVIYKLDTSNFQTNSLVLSPLVLNFKYLDAQIKHQLCLALAHVVKNQTNLKHVVLENSQMNLSEGIRLLLLLALGAGHSLKTLNLWYYFKNGLLPIPEKGQTFSEYDHFKYSREEDLRPSESSREFIWHHRVINADLQDIPSSKICEYFKISLGLLENLTVLWIHYAWLAGSQGRTLCQLGCIKFKTLKSLHLLYNDLETTDIIKQKISRAAWKYVESKVPRLEVSLTLVNIYHYNDVKSVLMDNIPLVEFNMTGGMIFRELANYKPPWLDCIFRMLVFFYSKTLKRISIENWHPHQLMDVSIGKLLTKIPSLEEFEYQGQLDKCDTVNKICQYLMEHKTRIKRVHLLIQYDPCFPRPWEEFVSKMNNRYKDYLSTLGIDFVLKLYKS
ncbi:uncharacterized protein LOC106668197 [Cimex lectularius]|uniref:Uncharacterized protein n=1 Tax=Cimex lectularius TaxID=79782 RepID=A0A8I6TFH5_CIMLE|nr:uncharacterized protein LOC106668197 [Cimex lectularius]